MFILPYPNHGEIFVGLPRTEVPHGNATASDVAVPKSVTPFVLHILPPGISPNYHLNALLVLGTAGSISGLNILAEALRMYLFK